MAKLKKDPSKAGVSAASVKGNAGPHSHQEKHHSKVNSQNNQFKKQSALLYEYVRAIIYVHIPQRKTSPRFYYLWDVLIY